MRVSAVEAAFNSSHRIALRSFAPRFAAQKAALALTLAILTACGGGGGSSNDTPATPTGTPGPTTPPAATRTWKMGFATNPPRPTVGDVVKNIDLFSTRAELVAIHEELPWTELLAGMSPDAILDRDKVQLVDYLRAKGLQLYVMLDSTDGLSRAEEAPKLRAAKRSLTESAVQQLYRSYALAVARKLKPEFIGLAPETNLIRAAAPAALYNAVVKVANDAAADLRAAGSTATLIASVQVETAWGVLGTRGPYVGVERDFTDFAFMQMLGLSSYPYFGYTQPEDIPADYYTRLLGMRTLPVMVVEGGWTSATAGTITSTPAIQARYIARHAQLLDAVSARGVIQIMFADLDLATWPAPIPANLPLFANLGLVDSNFAAKPALAEWDALKARAVKQ